MRRGERRERKGHTGRKNGAVRISAISQFGSQEEGGTRNATSHERGEAAFLLLEGKKR